MRMRLGHLVLLASCGRLGFEARRDGPVGDGGTADDGAAACPASYGLGAGTSRYRVEELPLPWLDAELGCEADGPGTHLAVIDDAAESDATVELTMLVELWVGTSQRVMPGTWRHVTGATATYVGWASGYPVAGPLDCVYREYEFGLVYRNIECDMAFPSLCECDATAPDRTAF